MSKSPSSFSRPASTMLDDDDSLSETSGRGGRRRDGSIKSEEMEETC